MKERTKQRLGETVEEAIVFLNISPQRVNELMDEISVILDGVEDEPWKTGAVTLARFTLLAKSPQEEQFLAFFAGVSFGRYLEVLNRTK